MFMNPNTALAEKWVQFPEWMEQEARDKCIQPNAIDVTCDRVFSPATTSGFELSEMHKVTVEMKEQLPGKMEPFIIPPGGWVDVMSDFHVKVPEGMVASFITRSTLNRNGLFVTNGLYDQGFDNYCGFVLHNRSSTPAKIWPHTRIAQLYFVSAQSSGMMYSGIYNNNKGSHWLSSTTTTASTQPTSP